MNALVTGATGLVGGRLVARLVERGDHVTALVRPEHDASELEALGVAVLRGDLRDPVAVTRAVASGQHVFHLGGLTDAGRPSGALLRAVNVGGTANLARAAVNAGVERFVFASTVGVYGSSMTARRIDETTPPCPDSPYRASKLAAEGVARTHAERGGLPLVVARLAGVLGPGAVSWLPLFRAVAAPRFRMLGDGANRHHYVDVDDVAEGLLRCGTVPGALGRSYILAGPEPVALRSFFQMIAEAIGVAAPRPGGRTRSLEAYGLLDRLAYRLSARRLPRADRVDLFLGEQAFDVSRAERELGHAPRVSTRDSVRRTAEWLGPQLGLRAMPVGRESTVAPGASNEPRSRAEELPLVSVVVEGYNERRLNSSVTGVLDALAAQRYTLDRIELILVGDGAQGRSWEKLSGTTSRFARTTIVEAEGALYYVLKNRGAQQASGDVIAFIDSDVYPDPGWVSSIVAAIAEGADVTAGVSTFWNRSRLPIPKAVLQAAASVSFGHVAGDAVGTGATPRGIVAHNLAFRAEVFHAHPFQTVLGRNCGIALMREALWRSGAAVRLVQGQRVAHSFALGWFFVPFHLRVGWEEYTLRRIDPDVANRWMRHLGPLEPVVTMLAYVGFDARAWFRYGRQIGLGTLQRWARLPVVVAVSAAARAVGAAGMLGGMLWPTRMRAWAEAQ